MPTIGDNIKGMAALVADVKKTYHLTEPTILRIVDMNFALAQGAGAATFSGNEDLPFDPGDAIGPDGEDINTGQIVVLHDNDVEVRPEPDEDESLATTDKPLEN